MQDRPVFNQLLIGSSLRGSQSTGVGVGFKDGDSTYLKCIGDPYKFLNLTDKDPRLDADAALSIAWKEGSAVFGHTRYATTGAISTNNAHPFQAGHITLAHNGTLWNHASLARKKYEVDSEVAADYISNVGIETAVKDIDGAFCFTYVNTDDKTFNIVRNHERPLWIAENQYRNTWYYASERDMLLWILERNRITYTPAFQPAAGELITFDLTAKKQHISKKKLELKGPKVHGGAATAGSSSVGSEYNAPPAREIKTLPPRHNPPHTSVVPFVTPAERQRTERLKTRDYVKGNEYVESCGGKSGTRYVGHFDMFQPATTSQRYGIKDLNGTLLGKFDDVDASAAIIRAENHTLRDWEFDGNKKFIPDFYSFTLRAAYYDSDIEGYVIVAGDLKRPTVDNDVGDWITLGAPKVGQDEVAEVELPVENPLADCRPLFMKGYGTSWIPRKKWDEYTKDGCQNCKMPFSENDSDIIVWTAYNKPLCPDCIPVWLNIAKANTEADVSAKRIARRIKALTHDDGILH